MSMIQMIDKQPVLEGGYKTIFEIKNEPTQVKDMIMEGLPDFAVVPTTMAALLYNKGQDYILTAITVWGTLYLFGTDTTIHGWSQLKGKRISLMAKGNSPDVIFRFLALKNGIVPEQDFSLDYSFPGHIELANAIAANVSNLGVISEPMASMVQQINPNVRPIIDLNQEWNKYFNDSVPFAQTALLVKKEFLEKYPSLVDEYLNLLQQSILWVNAFPNDAAGLIKSYGILADSSLALISIPRCNIKYADAYNEKKGIQEYLKVFYNFNPLIIGEKLPDAEFYYQKKVN